MVGYRLDCQTSLATTSSYREQALLALFTQSPTHRLLVFIHRVQWGSTEKVQNNALKM